MQNTIEQQLAQISSNNANIEIINKQIGKLSKLLNIDNIENSLEKLIPIIAENQIKCQEYENKLNLLTTTNVDLNLQIEQLKKDAEIHALSSKINIDTLTTKIEFYKDANKKLEKKQIQLLLINTAQDTRIKTLLSKNAELENKITYLEDIKNKLNSQLSLDSITNKLEIDDLNEKLRICNKEKDKLITERNQLKDDLEIIKNNLESNNKDLKDIIDNSNNLHNAEKSKLNEQIQRHNKTIIYLSLQNNSLLNKIKKLKDENIKLSEQLQKISTTNMQLQESKEQLQESKEQLQESKEQLQQQFDKNQIELNDIKEQIKNLETKLSITENVNTEQLQFISNLKQAKLQLEETNTKLLEELTSTKLMYEEKLNKLKIEIQEKTLRIKNNNINNLDSNLNLVNEIKELQKIQNALELKILELNNSKSKELIQLEFKYKKTISILNKEKDELNLQLKTTNANKTEILNNLKYEYDKKIEDLTKSLVDIQIENNTLKETIDRLNAINNILTLKNEQLSMINNDQSSKITQLNIEIERLNNLIISTDNDKENIIKQKLIETQVKYKNQLDNLTDENDKLNKQISSITNKLLECNKLKTEIETQLIEKTKLLETTISNTLSNNQIITKYKQDLIELNNLLLLIKSENEALKMQLEEQLTMHNEKTIKMEKEIGALKNEIYILTNDNNTLKDGFELQIKEINNQSSILKKECEIKLKQLQNKYSIEQQKINNIVTKLKKYMLDKNNINLIAFKKLEQEFIIINSKYDSNFDMLKDLIIKLAFENLNLSNKIKQLENSVYNIQKLNTTEKEKYTLELNNEIERLTTFIRQKELELNQLKSKSNSNEINLFKSVEELSKCKNEITRLIKLIQEKDLLVNELKKELELLKAKIIELNSTIKIVNDNSKISNNEKLLLIEQLTMNKNDLENKLNNLQTQYSNNIKNYISDIDKCKKSLTICDEDLNKCKFDLINCSNKNVNIVKINQQLQSQLNISNAKISQLESDKKNLEEQLTNLTNILSNSNRSNVIVKEKINTNNNDTLLPPFDNDIQIIYKYIDKPSNVKSKNNIINNLTPFDKYIDKPSNIKSKNNIITTPFDKYILKNRD